MLPEDAGDRFEESNEGTASRPRWFIVSVPIASSAVKSWYKTEAASLTRHATCRKGRVTIGFVILAALGIAILATLGIAALIVLQDQAGRRGLAGPGRAPAQATAAPATNNNQAPLDPAAVRSRLVVLTIKNEKEPRQVVVLGRPAVATDIPDYKHPARLDMLPREMVRQAVLIAARDELGLATRDLVIDATVVGREEDGAGTVEVVSFIRENRSREQIRRVANERVETLCAHETPTTPGQSLDLVKLLASAEALSREEFPRVLASLGLKGKPNEVKEEAGLPEKVEDRLSGLRFLDALLAVRDLHAAIRSSGESPARLGAIVRGYALLGVLNEFEWHPAHRAFKARSLLYAQRLVARDPDGPWGLWHRAFALALAGRHADALADLDAAKKKADVKGSLTAPDWLDLVDAYSRYDSARMARQPGPRVKLAAFLRMVALAFPLWTAAGLQAAKDVVLLEPYCFRAHDTMSTFSGVSTQHVATTIGPQALEQFVSRKLGAVDEVPKSVKDHLDDKTGIMQAAELFDKAGAPENDAGEPAWGALGYSIRETRFVQIYRRLYFMRMMWSVPTEEYWNEIQLDVAAHRYRPYLETLAVNAPDAAARFYQFADAIDLADVEPTEATMNHTLDTLERPRAKAVWQIAICHADETAEFVSSLAREANVSVKVQMARDILHASPYQPYARAVLIENDWENVKDQVVAWEKEAGDFPAVLGALGVHYSQSKNYDEAMRVLARYIDLSPEVGAFRLLAANFKAQGKIDRWQETLEAFLNHEDLGLDHAQVRAEIANYFIGLKQWDKARPYAEQAAQTGAGWAMDCAARCAEGEKDWDRAEAWYRQNAERYPSESWAVWYFFCKRTGQGNLDAARAFVEEYVTARADRPDLHNEEYSGCFHWLEGRTEVAKSEFAKAYQTRTSISAALNLAMIADDEKNAARRDELLKELVSKYQDKAPKSMATCRILLDSIFAQGATKPPLDTVAIDRLIDSLPAEKRSPTEFFAGWFLKNHGYTQNAKKYLESCHQSPHTLPWYAYLAGAALKQMAGK